MRVWSEVIKKVPPLAEYLIAVWSLICAPHEFNNSLAPWIYVLINNELPRVRKYVVDFNRREIKIISRCDINMCDIKWYLCLNLWIIDLFMKHLVCQFSDWVVIRMWVDKGRTSCRLDLLGILSNWLLNPRTVGRVCKRRKTLLQPWHYYIL